MVLSPKGNNELGSWTAFDEKSYYEAVASLSGNSKVSTVSFDTAKFLGRLDTKGKQILLPNFNTLNGARELIQMTNDPSPIALEMVAIAFDKLRNRMNYLATQGRIATESNYANLAPVNSYIPWEIGYENHVRQIIDSYYEYHKRNEEGMSVENLRDFIISFQDFVSDACPYTMFTLKSYSLSRFADPLESGMIVELSSDDPSDDERKFVDYLADPNYSIFLNEAAYYGFAIDEKIPWRLIMNPESSFVQDYLQQNNYSSFQSYLDDKYVDPTQINFQLFLEMLYRIYDNLVTKSPQVTKFDLSNSCKYYTTVPREKVVIENDIVEIIDKIGEDNIVKLYAFVRFRETNQDIDQNKFNNLSRNAINFKKHVDFSKAIEYIEEKAKRINFNKTRKSLYRI